MVFANVSYARQKTNQPLNFTDSSPNVDALSRGEQWNQGYGLTKLTMLPKYYGNVEAGFRFGDVLTVGANAKYYGESKITMNELTTLWCGGKAHTEECGYVKKKECLKSN